MQQLLHGIAAMRKMDEKIATKEMSNNMNLFVLLNTLSIQIFPTTLISIMASFGSKRIGMVVVFALISSFITFCIVMGIGKWLFREKL